MIGFIAWLRSVATALDGRTAWHSLHGVLEIGYLSFYLAEGLSLRSVFVVVLILHSGIEVLSRKA